MIKLNEKKKNDLILQARQLREQILQSVKKNGGHLAGNLGVTELTIALHELFQFPTDKLLFDVGHQSYAHKILSGRSLQNLRQMQGVSGFNDPLESEFDSFIAGHSGNSISAALGICAARDIKKEQFTVVVVIGDASITNGLALESLFSNKQKPNHFIVILNDNDMSISPNTSALQQMSNTEREIFFKSCGFEYLQGGDGHDFENLFSVLERAKENTKATFIHLKTVKGKGLVEAEKNACIYHSLQKEFKNAENDFSLAIATALENIAQENKDIVVLTPAMQYGLALEKFFKKYPERAYDVGICESHAFTMAAGMAKGGLKPIVCTYSTFLQRAYDQLIHDICIQNLPVVICLDRAGFVGGDGKTHQGMFDIPAMRAIPNLQIYAPKDCKEGELLLQYALQQNGPVVLRYPNAKIENLKRQTPIDKEHLWEVLQEGTADICLVANGARAVHRAMEVAKQMPQVMVVNARTIQPLDEVILKKIEKKYIVTIEESYFAGGFGSCIAEYYSKNKRAVQMESIAVEDMFIDHGQIEEQAEVAKISVNAIYNRLKSR